MKLTVPFYLHKAGAGFPSPATDYIEEDIDLNLHLIKNVPATFVIRVQGKSMTDVGVNDGDILVVDKRSGCSYISYPPHSRHYNIRDLLKYIKLI